MNQAKLEIIRLIADLTQQCIVVQKKLTDKPRAFFWNSSNQLIGLGNYFQNHPAELTNTAYDELRKELSEAVAAVVVVADNASAGPAAIEVSQAIGVLQAWPLSTASQDVTFAAHTLPGSTIAAALPKDFTTLAVGEEKAPLGEKWPWGEKHPFGEKHPLGEKLPFSEKFPFGEKGPLGESGPGSREGPWSIQENGPSFPWQGGNPFGGFGS